MPLATHRIDDNHRMYRIAERCTKFQRRLADRKRMATFVRKKQLMLRDALEKSGCQQLRVIGVVVMDGSVVLQGCVKSFYLKQLAQESVRPIAKGMRIVNRIRVS